jgi:uncharacterized membrane protein (DUF2068 family)
VKAGKLGLRTIALFEAAKGAIVLVAGSGLLVLVHRDVQAMAARVIAHLHLNPASRYPRIFYHLATQSSPARLQLLALGAFLYSIVRVVEAAGLWHERHWAEWLGIATAVIYLPFEMAALVRTPGPEPLVALAINLGVVMFLGMRLREDRRARAHANVSAG